MLMKRFYLRLLSILLCAFLFVPLNAEAVTFTPGTPYQRSLQTWIKNEERRRYVERMLDYHVRTNKQVQHALAGGYSAVFLFDGASDHMDDPELSDLTYYRVSGVCVVLRMDAAGEVKMVYINDNASTLPDRPLAYGAWQLPKVGEVGPATILDGTYQLYSVYHKGQYEALHVRSNYQDDTLPAVYMTQGGYYPWRADEINVHTRTSNHTAGIGMWSAGCPLVGGGDKWEYWKLMEATYHRNYDTFEPGSFVGSLVVDRQLLRREMYTLYKDAGAVDAILSNTLSIQPSSYLETCGHEGQYAQAKTLRLVLDSELMTLPCSNATDARSEPLIVLPKGETVQVSGCLFNSRGNLWYETEYDGQRCYLYSGHTEELT